MEKEQFLQLLKKYRSGAASPAEMRLLKAYYRAFELKPDNTNELTAQEQAELYASMQEAIEKQLSPPEKVAPVRSPFWNRAAAAAVIILAAGIAFFWTPSPSPSVVSYVPSLQTPASANNLIELPDGSTVILSAGSKLDYAASFEQMEKREVYLTGEAYFDVVRRPEQPFLVHTGKLVTTVLGTSFNIKALPDDKSITVTVTQGKVRVGDQGKAYEELLPNQQVVYDIEEEKIRKESVDADNRVAWKLNDLYCDDVTLPHAGLLIKERYGFDIEITDDALKSKRFTTTFGKEEPLESVLNSIAFFNEATYTIDSASKTVIFSSKQP